MEKLKELALYENSLLIFTSDHGESLGDHGSPDGYGWFLYAEQVQVPLIMKFPGDLYARLVDQVVRHIDIMPTVLDSAGVKFEKKSMNGESLLPAIKGDHKLGLVSYHSTGPSRVCPEGLNGVIFEDQNRIYHYTQGRFSSRYRELFELRGDPDEIRNLVENTRLAAVVKQAQQHLARFRPQPGASGQKASSEPPQKIPRKKLEALKALGYVAGGAPAPSKMSHDFLMQVRLDSIGTVVYSDFIRHPEWGKSLQDGHPPRKLVTVDNNRFYIISEPRQTIFRYRKNEGFRDLTMEGVTDLVPRSDGKSLYIVRLQSFGRSELPGGICSLAVDSKGDLWVLEKDAPAVTVLDRNGVKKGSFIYNSYDEKWERPVPCLQLFICLDRIYIMDSWEGIFVYSLE